MIHQQHRCQALGIQVLHKLYEPLSLTVIRKHSFIPSMNNTPSEVIAAMGYAEEIARLSQIEKLRKLVSGPLYSNACSILNNRHFALTFL